MPWLLRKAQSYALKPQLRLVPHQIDELHEIYKRKKESLVDEILKRFDSDTLPYPLGVMHKAIKDELNLRGVPRISPEQFRRVYAAVMDVEKMEPKETAAPITFAARQEVEKVLLEGQGG